MTKRRNSTTDDGLMLRGRRGPRFASALRETLADGYHMADLRADVQAGIVVGLVALPLSMALAVATHVPPQHGLYTAIVAGLVIGFLGGSRVQVSGPTAAFVVVLVPIVSEFGLGGLLLATMMAGGLLVALGVARLGGLIQMVPYPVTTGFTAGIGVVIATLQLENFLGLHITDRAESYIERVAALVHALPSARLEDLAVGIATLALLLAWPRVSRRVPAPLVALLVATIATAAIAALEPSFSISTIGSRFSYEDGGQLLPGIPRSAPTLALPWSLPGPDGRPLGISFALIRALLGPALAIAVLGAIESLLSAVVADGMTGHRHDPDAELVAQGIGNIVAPLLGGIAATGAIARTATNVRSGARSPVATVVHALFVLASVLALAPWLGALPMASLAALLLVVAWNMSEVRHFARTLQIAPRSDVLVQLSCFATTVLFDMVVAVLVGLALASFLFMRRMVEVFGVRLIEPELPGGAVRARDLVVLEIAGPLFFGAAHKAVSALTSISSGVRIVVLDVRGVPAMDATAIVNLTSTLERLNGSGVEVVVSGLQAQPKRALERAGWAEAPGRLVFTDCLEEALMRGSGADQPMSPASGSSR